ncbi:MAG TPA: o-succinylbenzoate synthase [Cyclobacteriaceae bacterium]|nr:o-succinylbenzoate synthase [Cyclobacteriaceae bacterium]
MIKIHSGKYNLKFRFVAGTSRGELTERDTWYVRITDDDSGVYGLGECAPIPGFSPDASPVFGETLAKICLEIQECMNEDGPDLDLISRIDPELPSVKMGFETALNDLHNGGKRVIFENGFHSGNKKIPINGLVWMGSRDFMEEQIYEKIREGFACIKIKIGAMDSGTELDILRGLRKKYGPQDLAIRVDANGAFSADEVHGFLDQLAQLKIHSIEQPLKPVFMEELSGLCRNSPVPIALDESLVGHAAHKERIIDEMRPAYIVLKPTLLGGFNETDQWIRLAGTKNIGWWITSFLESNIGLNALCQYVAEYDTALEQGLGTGKLYHNNIGSPLRLRGDRIYYSKIDSWDLTPIMSLFG